MHLDILNVPFSGCGVDTIGMLPTMSKGHRFVLTFICLVMSLSNYSTIKDKEGREITMAYLKEILPKHHAVYVFYKIME